MLCYATYNVHTVATMYLYNEILNTMRAGFFTRNWHTQKKFPIWYSEVAALAAVATDARCTSPPHYMHHQNRHKFLVISARRSKCTLTLSSIMLIHTHCILIELYVPFYHIFSFAAMPERSIFFSSWPTSTTSENVWRNMHERHASDGASHSLSLSLVLYGSDVANLTFTQICFLFSSSFFCFSLGGTLNCGEKWCGPNQKNGYAYIQTVCVWHAVLHRSPKDFLVRSSSLLCTWNDCGWRCSVQDTLPSDNVDFRTTRK